MEPNITTEPVNQNTGQENSIPPPPPPPPVSSSEPLDFVTAIDYTFNRPVGMFNILWMFLPIIGWFVLGGYGVRIVQEFCKGNFKELPTLKFGNDLKLGFMMFIKIIPLVVAYSIVVGILSKIHPALGGLTQFIVGFYVFPILIMNFLVKETVESSFDFKIVEVVFNNLGDYIILMLKSIGLGIIFIFMWLILIGIPAGVFTKNIFLADFYRRKVK